MLLSRYFLPILKETPKEAEIVSHRLMLRAGMLRQQAAGIYSWLPLGLRVLKKIEQIVREEQDRAGALEVLMPTIQSAELWRESGRYEDYGKEMLRIVDRHERDMLYGPTNEEMITVFFLFLFINYYGDWLWFKNLGYSSIFDTMILSKMFSFLVFFVIFALFSTIHIRLAFKRGSQSRDIYAIGDDDPRKLFLPLYKGKAAFWFWGLIIMFLGIVMGSSASGHWNDFLQFIHSSSFNLKEPVFGKDAGFYIFKLPVYRFAVNWYLFMTAFTFVAVLFSYYLDNAFNINENRFSISQKVKSHLILLAAFFGLGVSSLYIIKLFNILYSSHGATYGPSYMDIHAQIPAYWTIFIISLIITLLLFLYPVYKKRMILIYAVGAWLTVWVGFVWIYPYIIEQYSVKPNELKMETPYIIEQY